MACPSYGERSSSKAHCCVLSSGLEKAGLIELVPTKEQNNPSIITPLVSEEFEISEVKKAKALLNEKPTIATLVTINTSEFGIPFEEANAIMSKIKSITGTKNLMYSMKTEYIHGAKKRLVWSTYYMRGAQKNEYCKKP